MLSIILSRRDFREFDQIISLYTKERGKLELLARGVKKITSKNSAHLEPFSVVDATIEPGKEIDHLIRVQPVEYFSSIRSNLEKSLAARSAVSITDTLTQTGERDVRLFDALHGWLKFLAEDRRQKTEVILLDAYIIQLLHCLGFTPVLDECVVCGKSFQEMTRESFLQSSAIRLPPSGFYFAGGGLICPVCRLKKEKAGEIFSALASPASGGDCTLKEISDLALLLKGDWRKIADFNLSDDEQKKVHRLVYEYAVFHSEKKISDWDFCGGADRTE